MERFFLVVAYLVFVAFIFFARSSLKAKNPKHALLDDILLFTGSPVVFGYIIYLCWNPNTFDKPLKETFWSPTMVVMVSWMFVSYAIFLVRYYKNRK